MSDEKKGTLVSSEAHIMAKRYRGDDEIKRFVQNLDGVEPEYTAKCFYFDEDSCWVWESWVKPDDEWFVRCVLDREGQQLEYLPDVGQLCNHMNKQFKKSKEELSRVTSGFQEQLRQQTGELKEQYASEMRSLQDRLQDKKAVQRESLIKLGVASVVFIFSVLMLVLYYLPQNSETHDKAWALYGSLIASGAMLFFGNWTNGYKAISERLLKPHETGEPAVNRDMPTDKQAVSAQEAKKPASMDALGTSPKPAEK
jgi:hypothetical protein